MKKTLVLLMSITAGIFTTYAQETEEQLKSQLKEKNDGIAKLQGEASAIQAKIDALPGWKLGAFGTVGGNLSGFDNWYLNANPNNDSGSAAFNFNAYANYIQEKYFWRNSLALNLAWVKLDDRDDPTDSDIFEVGTDIFSITSLYGYNLSKTLAASALVEYRTAILEGGFNDPGYLDIGIGATWTPIKDLIVVFHPLNYNFVFSDEGSTFESSLGCKVVADYTRQLGKISFKTNFTGFLSYEDIDYSNWQWTNSFSYQVWKALGVGFDFGLRGNKQEAYNFALTQAGLTSEDLSLSDFDDNKIQSFWTLGATFNF